MGLADFLAQAGNRTAIGQVAQAFGGRTSHQQAMDDFTNQVQAITQEIHNNTDETKVRELGGKLLGVAAKAGIPIDRAEKLMEATIGPALHGIRQEGLNNLFDQYRGQPAVPGESRPEINGVPKEGPLTPQGNFIDPKAATPDKPLDLNFIGKFGQLTGANPAQFNQMLGTPAEIAGKQTSTQHTQAAIDAEKAKQETISKLPNTPTAPGQPSQQDVARVPGLAQFLDARGKPEDPLLEERRNLLNAQAGAATDRGAAARARAGAAGREGKGSGMMQDFIKSGGNPNDQEAYLQFADKYRGAGKTNETEADQAYGSVDRNVDLNAIAKEAYATGKTSSADIKAMAAKRGLVVEGEPQLTVSGGVFGYRGTPSLTGDFEFKRKPRVTTKSKTGATGDQGRYSEGVPSGSAPVPRDSKAGGAGSGGGKSLDADTAKAILQEAGGDKEKARAIAKQRGFKF